MSAANARVWGDGGVVGLSAMADLGAMESFLRQVFLEKRKSLKTAKKPF